MTRFARAKGSKSSNERVAEPATSWADMKKQIEQKKIENEMEKKKEEVEAVRLENYQKFLKEEEASKHKKEWCEFPQKSKVKDKKQNKTISKPPLIMKGDIRKEIVKLCKEGDAAEEENFREMTALVEKALEKENISIAKMKKEDSDELLKTNYVSLLQPKKTKKKKMVGIENDLEQIESTRSEKDGENIEEVLSNSDKRRLRRKKQIEERKGKTGNDNTPVIENITRGSPSNNDEKQRNERNPHILNSKQRKKLKRIQAKSALRNMPVNKACEPGKTEVITESYNELDDVNIMPESTATIEKIESEPKILNVNQKKKLKRLQGKSGTGKVSVDKVMEQEISQKSTDKTENDNAIKKEKSEGNLPDKESNPETLTRNQKKRLKRQRAILRAKAEGSTENEKVEIKTENRLIEKPQGLSISLKRRLRRLRSGQGSVVKTGNEIVTKHEINGTTSDDEGPPTVAKIARNPQILNQKQKKQLKRLQAKSIEQDDKVKPEVKFEETSTVAVVKPVGLLENKDINGKKTKKKKKKKNIIAETDEEIKSRDHSTEDVNSSLNKSVVHTNDNEEQYNKDGQPIKRKLAKERDEKSHKRRKPDAPVMTMIINGKAVDTMKFDGFPVKKEDHERLQQLKRNMISKGIPRSEVNATMKLERRKAEKFLARERKKVCFHCRISGHVLSECPEIGNSGSTIVTSGTGICFKCGNTEHTHFECKVVKTSDFKFAECFICKEQGHISRQCPDNPRGLYPKGGGCRQCGDVTHLRKDCPMIQQEAENNYLTLDTVGPIEGLEGESAPKVKSDPVVKKNKVVKF